MIDDELLGEVLAPGLGFREGADRVLAHVDVGALGGFAFERDGAGDGAGRGGVDGRAGRGGGRGGTGAAIDGFGSGCGGVGFATGEGTHCEGGGEREAGVRQRGAPDVLGGEMRGQPAAPLGLMAAKLRNVMGQWEYRLAAEDCCGLEAR